MKQTLFLMMLALGMCSINVSAQTKKPVRKASTQTKIKASPVPKVSREYQIGEDGFEWYKICKNGKYGAEDRNGNTIVPTEYDGVKYTCFCYDCVGYSPVEAGFIARKGEYKGWYNKSGKCIIPYSRGYTYIRKYDSKDYGTHYTFAKDGGGGICDRNGKVVVSVNIKNFSQVEMCRTFDGEKRHYLFFHLENGYCGAADANGNIIVFPEFEWNGHQKEFEDMVSARLKTNRNPLSGNTHETLAEAEGRQQGRTNNPVAEQQQQSGGTSTVVVEHHHDPVPVQEWHACIGCGGMGTMGCDFCGGSGTKYIGDRLHRCSRCNGRGIIPCNVCYGNKGQYVTVYK